MNFVWKNTSSINDPVERAGVALSCALFPTFANSERTAGEVAEMVERWTIPALAEKADVSWVNLGIRLDHVLPRRDPDVPVVLYPAIYLSERKQPQVFLEVVERLARRIPMRVEARLHESHLASETAMRLSLRDWAWVGPLTATREDYWAALARTTAFLATATDESYGLEYIEALVAGAVGVLPDRPWARAILPPAYPFLYSTTAEAEAMLFRAVTDTDSCRRQVDAAAGGSFAEWLRARHSDDQFDAASSPRWSACSAPEAAGSGQAVRQLDGLRGVVELAFGASCRTARDDRVRGADDDRATDEVAQTDEQEVAPERCERRTGDVAQEAQREGRHVGDHVLEAGRDEREQAPEDDHQPGPLAAQAGR